MLEIHTCRAWDSNPGFRLVEVDEFTELGWDSSTSKSLSQLHFLAQVVVKAVLRLLANACIRDGLLLTCPF